jgi:hypothetical protein
VIAPDVLTARRLRLGVILEFLQQRAPRGDRHAIDVLGAIQVEEERTRPRDGMRSHQRMRHLHQHVCRPTRGTARKASSLLYAYTTRRSAVRCRVAASSDAYAARMSRKIAGPPPLGGSWRACSTFAAAGSSV